MWVRGRSSRVRGGPPEIQVSGPRPRDAGRPICYRKVVLFSTSDDRNTKFSGNFAISRPLFTRSLKKQHRVAASSMEAEVTAANQSANSIKFIRYLLHFAFHQDFNCVLNIDNAGSIAFCSNPITRSSVRSIDVTLCRVREFVRDKIIEIRKIPSSENTSDIFTKPLGKIKHAKFTEELKVFASD